MMSSQNTMPVREMVDELYRSEHFRVELEIR